MVKPLYTVLVAVLLPFVAAPLCPYIYRRLGGRVAYYATAVAGVSFSSVTWLYVTGFEGVVSLGWISSSTLGYTFKLSFLVDGFSLLFGFIASGVGIVIMVYARGYLGDEPDQGRFFAYMLGFMGSMLGVVLSNNLVVLFVFWELTSLTSFLLIGFYTDDADSVYGARKSMVITVSGGLFLLVGFLLLHSITGTFSASALLRPETASEVVGSSLYIPVLGLVVIGAATKSAQFPFHVWLPNAMEAPTPVSAFLHSATMVKAGVYLLGRFSPVLSGGDAWTYLLAPLGLVTMLVGAVLAVGADDVKELLAYSTVSHLGLIVAVLGYATKLGDKTGVLHVLTHATFKASLFMVAGIASHAFGSRLLDEMGGLRKKAPVTTVLAVVAALSMAGVPPFSGFYTKEYLYEASLEASHATPFGVLLPLTAVVASVFTFVYSVRFVTEVFWGEVPDGTDVHSPSWVAVAPLGVLVGVVGLMSLLPSFLPDILVSDAVGVVHGSGVELHPHLPTSLTPAFVLSFVTLGLGVVTYLVRGRVHDALHELYDRAPRATADFYYDGSLSSLRSSSTSVVNRFRTGYLRSYVAWILVAASVVVVSGYVYGGISFGTPTTFSLSNLPLLGVLLLTVAASVAVPFSRSHVEGVLVLSIVGFMVGIFYVIVSAPDLAMTQIVIETITLVVFLLVIEKLPTFYSEAKPTLERGRDLGVSVLVGVTVAVTVLAARSSAPDKIADLLLRNSVPEGGGHNVVNVILVDFRGFDTLGETTVVGLAAVGVLTLVRMRGSVATEKSTEDDDAERTEEVGSE